MKNPLFIFCILCFFSCKQEVKEAKILPCEYVNGDYICEGETPEQAKAKIYCVYEIISSSGRNCIDNRKSICLLCTDPCPRTVRISIDSCEYDLLAVDRTCRKCPEGGVVAKIK